MQELLTHSQYLPPPAQLSVSVQRSTMLQSNSLNNNLIKWKDQDYKDIKMDLENHKCYLLNKIGDQQYDSKQKIYQDHLEQKNKKEVQQKVGDLIFTQQFTEEECKHNIDKTNALIDHEGFKYLRRIRGDGNCYYRALIFQYFEKILLYKDTSYIQKFYQNVSLIDLTDKPKENEIKYILIECLEKLVQKRQELQQKQPDDFAELVFNIQQEFLSNPNFDYSAIIFSRSMIAKSIKENSDKEPLCFIIFDEYEKNNLLKTVSLYSEDVQESLVYIGALTFEVNIRTHSYFVNNIKDKKIHFVQMDQFPPLEGSDSPYPITIDIFRHSGHYLAAYEYLFGCIMKYQDEQKVVQQKEAERIKDLCEFCQKEDIHITLSSCQHNYCRSCFIEVSLRKQCLITSICPYVRIYQYDIDNFRKHLQTFQQQYL